MKQAEHRLGGEPINWGALYGMENIAVINGGLLAVGILTGYNLQIVSQLISMAVVLAWALATGFAIFLVLKVTMGVRATREEEMEGLDMPVHGIYTYPELAQPVGAGGADD